MGIVNRSEDDVVVDSSLPSDALSSKQFATIVDVLSEGEIEGFPSAATFTKGTANYNTAALKDVYLVDNTIENWKELIEIDLKKSDEEKAEIDFIIPNKPMYRIFEINDIKELKGFSGEWLVQEKYDGIRIQIHKQDSNIKIYTYNKKDITDKCKKIVDRLKAKQFGDVILDAELILYDKDEPLHRADTIAHLFKN